MAEPSFMATFMAIGLIPIAFFITYALLSGLKRWKHHQIFGLIGVCWDLAMSLGYMVNRLIGESASIDYGGLLGFIIVHGIISTVVLSLDFVVLITGVVNWKAKVKGDKKPSLQKWHKRLAMGLYVLWFTTLFMGETIYVSLYVI